MRVLLWIVRIYSLLIILWALSSWFGGIPNPVGQWLSYLMAPIWFLFGWARIGSLSLAAVIALLLLYALESWLRKRVGESEAGPAEPPV